MFSLGQAFFERPNALLFSCAAILDREYNRAFPVFKMAAILGLHSGVSWNSLFGGTPLLAVGSIGVRADREFVPATHLRYLPLLTAASPLVPHQSGQVD